MPVTIETRAIHVNDMLKDLIITSVHMPKETSVKTKDLISQTFEIPSSLIVSRDDLGSFWNSLPDHIHTDFPDKKRPWIDSDEKFLFHTINTMMLGSFQYAPIVLGNEQKIHIGFDDPFSRVINWYFHTLKYDKKNNNIKDDFQNYGIPKVHMFASLLMHFDGFFTPELNDNDWGEYISTQISKYDIPLSQSPGLEGITLKELAQKGIQGVCLFPLIAGTYGGIQHLFTGDCGIALKIVSTGGGMTIITFSTLWIADKIFANIKNLIPREKQGENNNKNNE